MASNIGAQLKHCFSAASLRAYLAEFISTFLFVFATVGSAISARMATPDATALVATAVAQAFGLVAAVVIAADFSGGHVNPAVTFAFAVGGRIGVPTAFFYWTSQLLGSTFACLVLHYMSAGQAVPTTRISVLMTGFGAAILEGVMTFMVVYTVHVVGDPRNGGNNGGRNKGLAATALGALVVGLVTGACVLASGPMTGASMNPARSFGPAVVSGAFGNQAVYWVGPMIGAGVAALVHQGVMAPPSDPESPHGDVVAVVV
ncbi:hypothetical protein QOZ80_4BG0339290 [Eleusine coracana subsp. coracana]|nr:hypothetical protein QOZ80_4BG0339290 [Eleusine coracana subsp. coracana]